MITPNLVLKATRKPIDPLEPTLSKDQGSTVTAADGLPDGETEACPAISSV